MLHVHIFLQPDCFDFQLKAMTEKDVMWLPCPFKCKFIPEDIMTIARYWQGFFDPILTCKSIKLIKDKFPEIAEVKIVVFLLYIHHFERKYEGANISLTSIK